MIAATPSATRATASQRVTPAVHPRRFTVDEYHRLGEAGILTENDRCELISGIIVEKPVINPPHKKCLRRVNLLLAPLFTDDWVVDSQGPITLAASEPEPDFSAARGPESRYDQRHAGPGDVVFVLEIADTSLAHDRGEKLTLYAAAKIPVYWIVNLPDRRVEVYTQPRGGKNPTYRARTDYLPGQSVPVTVAGTVLGSIPVSELLP